VFAFPPLTPFVKKLIITLLVAFVLEVVLQNWIEVNIIGLLGLDPVQLSALTPLQLVSYVLIEALHPGAVMSMLIGLIFMWLILSPFEATFGSRATAELVLAGTLGGSLAVVAAASVLPIPGYLFLGSHTIAYGGMAAMAQVMRGGRMMFFGVLPMTSKQLLIVLVALSLLEFLLSKDHLRLAGSLGAMLAGVGYIRYLARPRKPKKPRGSAPRFRVLPGGGSTSSSDPSDRPKWLN
jgi:membrane associated rhomboid family serine protease